MISLGRRDLGGERLRSFDAGPGMLVQFPALWSSAKRKLGVVLAVRRDGATRWNPGRGERFARVRYQPLTGLRKEIASWFWSWISTRSLGCPLYRKTGSCASTDGRPHRVVACLRSLGLQKHWEGVLYIQGRTNSFQHHTKRKPPCATKVTYQSAPISVDVQEPKNAPGCC